MPAKIFMNISRDGGISSHSKAMQALLIEKQKQLDEAKAKSRLGGLGGLNGQMVQRIHTVKPGCGACGK